MELVTGYSKLSIKHIFQEHWDNYLAQHKDSIPSHISANIDKMLNCRNPNKLGFHKYTCSEHPEHYKIIPHSCKSRFCNTCGKILTDKWVNKLNTDFPFFSFHHIVFTIPESLRGIFQNYPALLNCLFTAAALTVLSYAKEKHFLPAVICALHTFGSSLNYNSHIHMLVTAGGISLKSDKLNQWKPYPQFPYQVLRKRWRFLLITLLKEAIKSYLKQNPDCGELSIFSNPDAFHPYFEPLFKMDWYVYESDELEPENFTSSYIVRYTKRPPLAEYRLHNYYKEHSEHFVTFSYKEKKTKSTIRWSLPVEDFMQRLIQHIPPHNFRQVRSYGLLANRVRSSFLKIVPKLIERTNQMIKFQTWRKRQIAFTGQDPLKCPICERTMILSEIAYFSKKLNALDYYHPT